MVWPFSKKNNPQGLPLKFISKSGADFLNYQCKFGFTEIRPKQGIVALVLDASKEFGTDSAVKVDSDGIQTVVLRVASEDGGFIVFSQTASGKGDRLKPDDVVIWVPLKHSTEVIPEGADNRFGWVGFIMAKVKPEIDISNPNFEILSNYD